MATIGITKKTKIWVSTSFEGFHRYPDAPEEVKFLRDVHRHIFHIKVWIEVFHNDRDIEFIIFKRFVESLLTQGQMDYMSCEMISDELHSKIMQKFPMRDIWISVSEDDENGSYVEYNVNDYATPSE